MNRYIPPEVLLAELEKCVGGLCDVSQIVTEYIAEHTKRDTTKNPTDAFIGHMHQLRDELTTVREEYDISDSNESEVNRISEDGSILDKPDSDCEKVI